jgi:hypothetical protein
MNIQKAEYPSDLADLVDDVRYKDGWDFRLEVIDRGQGCEGLTLDILLFCPDAYHPETMRGVHHYFPVPAAAYNAASWRRWLFDRVLDVETHEAMEWFELHSTQSRPYAPLHSPGNDPYVVRELTTDEERRTSFRGVVKPARSGIED